MPGSGYSLRLWVAALPVGDRRWFLRRAGRATPGLVEPDRRVSRLGGSVLAMSLGVSTDPEGLVRR